MNMVLVCFEWSAVNRSVLKGNYFFCNLFFSCIKCVAGIAFFSIRFSRLIALLFVCFILFYFILSCTS